MMSGIGLIWVLMKDFVCDIKPANTVLSTFDLTIFVQNTGTKFRTLSNSI